MKGRANVIGAAWMVLAMAFFAIEDVFVKTLSDVLPIGQILIIFGLGGSFVFAALALRRGEPLMSADVISRPMCIRVVFEITGRLFYILAITLTPLSSATVILQATPIVVVAGAAIVFGEAVGWRRWAAIVIGLIGVVVIVRPGTDSFSLLSIFAVIATLGFAGRDLASRAAPAALSTAILGLYGFLAVIVAGAAYSLWDETPFAAVDTPAALYLFGAVILGAAAYGSLMKAMRTGDVSAVTPFRYSRLLFGVGFGVVLFNEAFDLNMLIGCVLIVVSGLRINASRF